METKGIESVLAQLRAAREMAAAQLSPRAAVQKTQGADFGAMLKSSLQDVSRAQTDASQKAQAFEIGAPGASLHDAMISLQKANISFQATVQVRNKVIAAYHEIMNMQV